MLNFLKHIKPKQKKPEVNIVFIVLVFFVALTVAMIWSIKSPVYAYQYLPAKLSFYYQWTDPQQPSGGTIIYQTTEPNEHLAFVKNLLGEDFTKLEELIWWQSDSMSTDNNYLLRFSRDFRKQSNTLAKANTDLDFYHPNKYVLLISRLGHETLGVGDQPNSNWQLDDYPQGTNLYWQINQPPEFLQELSTNLKPMLESDKIYANFYMGDTRRISMWQKVGTGANKSINPVLIPRHFDNAIAIGLGVGGDFQSVISESLLKTLFSGIPYASLDEDKIKTRLLDDSLVFTKDDEWLLVASTDWQDIALSLASELELVEKRGVLPDGTAYIEYVSLDQPGLIIKHQFQAQSYWQIDGLFGTGLGNKYYLTNNASFLRDTIANKQKVSDLWIKCQSSLPANITDFMLIKSPTLSDSQIKAYLDTENIDDLAFFAYYTDLTSGWQLCYN